MQNIRFRCCRAWLHRHLTSPGPRRDLESARRKERQSTGAWLDELQEFALLRANAHLTGMKERNAATAAISAVEVIFERMRSGLSDGS